MAQKKRPLRLQVLEKWEFAQPEDKQKLNVDIIAIPGFGTCSVSEWGLDTLMRQISSLPEGVSTVRTIVYDYQRALENLPNLQYCLELGDDLLELLLEMKASEEGLNRWILFVCHSLGGVLLKRALNIAHLQTQKFERMLSDIAGIVFLGTPHNDCDDASTWSRYILIMRTCNKHLGKTAVAWNADANGIYQVSHEVVKFELHAPRMPILSVYEGAETRVGRSRTFKSLYSKLVDRDIATTSAPEEDLLEMPLPHADLCRLNRFGREKRLIAFLERILKEGRRIMEKHAAIDTVEVTSKNTESPTTNQMHDFVSLPTPASNLRSNSWKNGASERVARQNTMQRIEHNSQVARPWILTASSHTRALLSSKKAELSCFLMPRYTQNHDFFGRQKELKELDEKLLPRQQPGTLQTFAVCGMGGVGKTDLTVNAAGDSQLASSFAAIPVALGFQNSDQAQDLIASREIAKLWLQSTETPWLLVFDNADNLDLLSDYWPQNGSGSILVTSRDPLAKGYWSFTMPGLDLESLPVEDAARFVRKVTACEDIENERKASREMALQLGCLPLAITQMAGAIRRRQWSVQEFVDKFDGVVRYESLRHIDNNPRRTRYGSTLATAWNFDDLKEGTLNLLKLLSMLSLDRIQERFFVQKSVDFLGRTAFNSEEAFEDAKEELLRSSVIKRNKGHKELWIHRVVSQEVRARMSQKDLLDTFNRTVSMLCSVWPFNDALENRHAISRWEICEELFPHLQQIHQLYRFQRGKGVGENPDKELVRLLQESGAYLHERGFSFQGKPYLELALDICKELGNHDHGVEQTLSDIYYTLGAMANETNDGPGCLQNNLILLEMRKKAAEEQGRPDVRLAAAHSQIGVAYMMMGKLALATEYFKESISIFKSLEDFKIDMLGFPVANLGLAYWIQGQLKSLQLHQASLAQLESTLGPYHHRVADLCHKISGHHIQRGEHAQAQAVVDRALGIWGNKDWYRNQTARSSYLKGTHLKSLGGKDAVKGERWIEKAQKLRREIVPDGDLSEEDFDDLVVFWSR